MGMRKQIAKGVGYAIAPKFAFTALNPKKAAMAKVASWAIDRVVPERRRRNRNRNAMGFGAAALAIPVGVWIGRRLATSRSADEFNNRSF